jgi:SAM-dependent methyltransferase
VIGSDISAGQLAEAPQAGNVEYCLLNAEWPLEQLQTAQPRLSSESVDLVTVAQALHYFDLDRFYENVKAVLKPNGLLAVWTYKLPVLPNNETANLLLQHIYYNVVGQYWAPERRLVNACYRTLPFPFEDVMRCVEEPWGAMRMTWDVGALMGYLRSWSATEKAIEVLGSNPVENYRHQFQAVWDPAGEAVEVPLYLCVGRPHNHS